MPPDLARQLARSRVLRRIGWSILLAGCVALPLTTFGFQRFDEAPLYVCGAIMAVGYIVLTIGGLMRARADYLAMQKSEGEPK